MTTSTSHTSRILNIALFALGLTLIAGLLSGCGDTIHAKSIAEPAITTFHAQLDDGNYSALYTDGTAEFQNAITEQKWTNLLAAIHRKLGNVLSTTNAGWNVNTYNLKTRVVMVQQTQFEKGAGTETFTFVISDGKPALLGYFINSEDMLTN